MFFVDVSTVHLPRGIDLLLICPPFFMSSSTMTSKVMETPAMQGPAEAREIVGEFVEKLFVHGIWGIWFTGSLSRGWEI
jgi:hypothetical protein